MQAERRPKRAVLIAAAVLAVFALLAADLSLGMHPRACSLCHGDLVEGQQGTAHSELGCLSCHLEAGAWSYPGFKADQWTRMYPKQLLGIQPTPARTVSRAACVSCHETLAPLTERNGLVIAHPSCAPPPASCASCHAAQSHGQTTLWGGQPVMEECVSCHQRQNAPAECDTCHQGRVQTERLRRGPWRVTHGPGWESTHAMGDYDTCSTCHATNFCAKCHGVPVPHPVSFGSTHGRYALADQASCDTCHGTQSFCSDCHGIEMPHPSAFLTEHKDIADSVDDPACVSCHEFKACTNCHDRHDAHPRDEELEAIRRTR